MAVPHAARSTCGGMDRAAPAQEQAPAAANIGDQQERIDGMSAAQFWAKVDYEKRNSVGPVLRGLRAHMHENQRPCVFKPPRMKPVRR